MADYSRAEIDRLIAVGLDKSLTTKARGDALEDLICYLFEELPGISVRRNEVDRFKSMEIDVTVANLKEAKWLQLYPNVFLIECKNWDSPVGSGTVSDFIFKLDAKYVELGIIVAANGITGDPEDATSAYHRISIAQSKGRRVLVIDLDSLKAIETTDDFQDLLREAFLDAIALGRV
jgi:hypothetical protein